jgi:hypothetical protein
MLGRGTATLNTATETDSGTIFSLMECPNRSGSKSWELSPWLCVKGNFCGSMMLVWLKAQSNAVAATFRENGHGDPKKDAKNNGSRLLWRQLRSYKKDNPKETQQKALSVCILRLILSSKSTEL